MMATAFLLLGEVNAVSDLGADGPNQTKTQEPSLLGQYRHGEAGTLI